MKKLSLLLGTALLVAIAGCKPPANASTEFWVRGNCDMCKTTIEDALNSVEGVSDADYDLETHTAKVAYDSTLVKVEAFHQACAAAGYETKLVPAVASAYQDLPKCCKKPDDN